jgi:hypothetical protein
VNQYNRSGESGRPVYGNSWYSAQGIFEMVKDVLDWWSSKSDTCAVFDQKDTLSGSISMFVGRPYCNATHEPVRRNSVVETVSTLSCGTHYVFTYTHNLLL